MPIVGRLYALPTRLKIILGRSENMFGVNQPLTTTIGTKYYLWILFRMVLDRKGRGSMLVANTC